jgi:hypothetical protein
MYFSAGEERGEFEEGRQTGKHHLQEEGKGVHDTVRDVDRRGAVLGEPRRSDNWGKVVKRRNRGTIAHKIRLTTSYAAVRDRAQHMRIGKIIAMDPVLSQMQKSKNAIFFLIF